MNAICGLLGAPAGLPDLRAMLAALPGRGKDAGEWTDGGIALGGRAEVRDQSPGCLSFDPGASLTLVGDVRLDDRPALCDALGVPRQERSEIADEALVLRAYSRWGQECPNHLLGDYAFAIWDANAHTFFCARDHMGVRPFYYAYTSSGFAFASAVEAVLAAPGVDADLDEASVAEYLTGIALFSTTRTFFEGVKKLPPGHSLALDAPGTARPQPPVRHWHPEQAPRLPPASDDGYAEQFLALYSQAVADRLPGSGAIGVHVSGGLDSSSVAVLAARHLQRQGRPPPLAFSWLPDLAGRQPEPAHAKEYALIDAVCATAGLQVRHCAMTPTDITALLRRDGVFPGSMVGHEDAVQRTAEALGVRVVLSGWGGDEGASFDGRGHLESMLLRGHWRRLAGACRERGIGPWRLLLNHVLPLIAPGMMLELRRLKRGKPLRARRGFAEASFRRRMGPRPERIPRYLDVRRAMLALLDSAHLSARIEGWHANAARHDIEYRYPLLDRRVLEFALGLPPDQFRRGRWNRLLMRHALRTVLPAEVCWHTSKMEPARVDTLLGAQVLALPAIAEELARRATPPSRATYVDMNQLLASLSAARIRAGHRNTQVCNALRFLDW